MEGSAFGDLFPDMEDQSFINQWMVESHEAMMPMETAFSEGELLHALPYIHHQLPVKGAAAVDDINNRPAKQIKANSWGSRSCIIEPTPSPESNNNFSASAAAAASFLYYPENRTETLVKPKPDNNGYNLYDDDDVPPQFTIDRLDYQASWNNESTLGLKSGYGAKRKVSSRSPGAQEHVIAERKRREKLSQRFIALSAVVPGLKKTDKATILADAVKYLKQLQERVKILENQTNSKTIESVVLVRKSKLLVIDENNKPAFSEGSAGERRPNDDQQFPEIEARVSDKDVLIRVHCEKKKGVMEGIFCEMSKLHLTVVNTSVLAFGTSAHDITIVAQMNADRQMTAKELVKALYMGFMSFMSGETAC